MRNKKIYAMNNGAEFAIADMTSDRHDGFDFAVTFTPTDDVKTVPERTLTFKFINRRDEQAYRSRE